MPPPVSDTSTSIASSVGRLRTVTTPPEGMASRLFHKRFRNTAPQLAFVRLHGRQGGGQLEAKLDPRRGELRGEEVEEPRHDLVEVLPSERRLWQPCEAQVLGHAVEPVHLSGDRRK